VRLALVQFAPGFGEPAHNWSRIRRWSEELLADVVVFPELASSGYMFQTAEELRPHADSAEALHDLELIARDRRRLLVGGFAERAGGRLYNSAFVVGPDGTKIFHKIHLWNYETEIFEPGADPLVVDFEGRRFGIEVCYDLQFPELGTYYARKGIDALLVPTAWPEDPVPPDAGLRAYTHLGIATAFAHGVFVAVVNRIGTERGVTFPGESSVSDPLGRNRRVGSGEEILTADLDFSLIPRARVPNPRNDLARDGRLSVALPPPRRATRATKPRASGPSPVEPAVDPAHGSAERLPGRPARRPMP
jgi:N-carbamoylputrescine amidase